jgi:hypothetical protein
MFHTFVTDAWCKSPVSPQLSVGVSTIVGKVGRERDLAGGRRAARLCALNLLATLKGACDDDLDRVTRIVVA